MSILATALPAIPAHAILPAVQTAVGATAGFARPLIGLGMLAALMVIFKPLLTGLLRAALLVLNPRPSHEERSTRRIVESVLMLNRMARDMENVQPSLAAEFRSIAARG
jgi:hypothetical protein